MEEVIDQISDQLAVFCASNAKYIQKVAYRVERLIFKPLNQRLIVCPGRQAQFEALQDNIEQAADLFGKYAKRINLELIMSLSRRLADEAFQDAKLTFYTLAAKYAQSSHDNNRYIRTKRQHAMALDFAEGDIFDIFRLIVIAICINRMQNMARWVGKGSVLRASPDGRPFIEAPAILDASVRAYEMRRPRDARFDSGGHFTPIATMPFKGECLIPSFLPLPPDTYIEAPLGSGRGLRFDRWPTLENGENLTRLLRAYDEAMLDLYGVGADHIMHFLTVLGSSIFITTPPSLNRDGNQFFLPLLEPPADFEHKLRFTFDLCSKGFFRFPKAALVEQMGKVQTAFSKEPALGKQMGLEFIEAFILDDASRNKIDYCVPLFTPFLLPSSYDHIYIDFLLLWDFLASIVERCKEWYSSAHGDRFVLDLKRWLDQEAPGTVVGAKHKIRLPSGAMSDIDLLVRKSECLYLVECKAYGKSRDFMIGDPAAVNTRRRRIREAVEQIDRSAAVLKTDFASGGTQFEGISNVQAIVCTPSVEFLHPLNEHGLLDSGIPRVMNPEELLQILRT